MFIMVENKTMDHLTAHLPAWSPAFPLVQARLLMWIPEQHFSSWHTNFSSSVIWYLTAVVHCSFILTMIIWKQFYIKDLSLHSPYTLEISLAPVIPTASPLTMSLFAFPSIPLFSPFTVSSSCGLEFSRKDK